MCDIMRIMCENCETRALPELNSGNALNMGIFSIQGGQTDIMIQQYSESFTLFFIDVSHLFPL
jgi:hypothetical protein